MTASAGPRKRMRGHAFMTQDVPTQTLLETKNFRGRSDGRVLLADGGVVGSGGSRDYPSIPRRIRRVVTVQPSLISRFAPGKPTTLRTRSTVNDMPGQAAGFVRLASAQDGTARISRREPVVSRRFRSTTTLEARLERNTDVQRSGFLRAEMRVARHRRMVLRLADDCGQTRRLRYCPEGWVGHGREIRPSIRPNC